MLRKPAHLIFYLSMFGLCNVLKYKVDTFYLSSLQKPALGKMFCVLSDTLLSVNNSWAIVVDGQPALTLTALRYVCKDHWDQRVYFDLKSY